MPWGNRPSKTIEERFWEKVLPEPNSGCWLWDATQWNGYGRFWVGGKLMHAHRYSFELYSGPIPEGMCLDHLCRNPSCVNPEHLEAVTPQENILRGKANAALNAAKTHCIRGHQLTGDNLYTHPTGRRICRTCRRAIDRKRRAKEG